MSTRRPQASGRPINPRVRTPSTACRPAPGCHLSTTGLSRPRARGHPRPRPQQRPQPQPRPRSGRRCPPSAPRHTPLPEARRRAGPRNTRALRAAQRRTRAPELDFAHCELLVVRVLGGFQLRHLLLLEHVQQGGLARIVQAQEEDLGLLVAQAKPREHAREPVDEKHRARAAPATPPASRPCPSARTAAAQSSPAVHPARPCSQPRPLCSRCNAADQRPQP